MLINQQAGLKTKCYYYFFQDMKDSDEEFSQSFVKQELNPPIVFHLLLWHQKHYQLHTEQVTWLRIYNSLNLFSEKFQNVKIVKYGVPIWNQYGKYKKMSTNMPMFGSVVLEIDCDISTNRTSVNWNMYFGSVRVMKNKISWYDDSYLI